MANTLSKTGIINGQTILPGHVTQSIDAFTGTVEYDITISGSLDISNSTNTGNLIGTASWSTNSVTALTATTASYVLNAVSSSFAATASSAGVFTVRTSLTASGLNYPTSDGTENEVIKTDGAGNLSFGHITTIYETVYAGENLVKTDPVYLSGSNGANPIAYKADAGNPAKSPAIYVMNETINQGNTGDAIALGLIDGVNLTGIDAGTEVYVGVGGGWTTTRPTGSATVQSLGVVTKGGSGGKGFVFNAGEASIPNITPGYAWVGNSGSIPVATPTSSFSVATSVNSTTTQNISSQYLPSGSGIFATGNLGMLAGSSILTSGASPIFSPTQLSGKIFQTEFWVTVTLASGSTTPGPNVSLYVESPGAGSFRIMEAGGTISNDDVCFTVMYLKP